MKNIFYLKILIVEDHPLVASGIELHLRNSFPGVECRIVSEEKEVAEAIDNLSFDLYLVDLELKGLTGFDVISMIRQRHADAPILICTMHEEIWYLRELNACGVNGVILKSSYSSSLIEAVQEILNGNHYYCPRFRSISKYDATSPYHHLKKESFSDVEIRLLTLIAQGKTSQMIGDEIGWSIKTVENYRKRLFDKFGVSNVAQLIAVAFKEGFIKKELI